jgi:glucose/arabinose dehydrogenase
MDSKRIFFLILILAVTTSCNAQIPQSRVVKDGLFIPWELVYGPDDHLWFTQKNGYICRLDPQSGHTDTLLHEGEVLIRGEGGMLGLAMHPQFPDSPYLYVAYNYLKSNTYTEKIVRYHYDGQTLTQPTVLLDDIAANNNHNGCRMRIVGDKLFITTGDAETGSRSQNPQSRNGKVLRIHLDGTIPSDNPIPGNPVWAWGLRNSQGLVFANNRLYLSEHGPSSDDEVNIVLKGRNYGWPSVAGFCNTPQEQIFCNDSNVVEPLRAWTPTLAVSGMDWYGAAPMFPEFHQSLLMATLKDEQLYRLQLNTSGDSMLSADPVSGVAFGRLRAVCVAPDGRVFISTSNSAASGTGAFIDRIIELYNPSSGGVRDARQGQLRLYPNPAAGATLYLAEHLLPEGASCRIADLEGRVWRSGSVSQGRVSIEGLPPGVYLLQATDPQGRLLTGRFVRIPG